MTIRIIRPVATRLAAAAAAAMLLLAVSWVWVSSPAYAHTQLISSDPPSGATLAQPPQTVTLSFSEPVDAEISTITVLSPAGARLRTERPQSEEGTVRIGLGPLSAAGRYTFVYRVISADGHPIAGDITFSIAAAAAATTMPAALPPEEKVSPIGAAAGLVWPWIVAVFAAVAAAVVAVLRRNPAGRRR